MLDSGEVSEELLTILVCPVCRVKLDPGDRSLVCGRCGRVYPIRDGIPDFVLDRDDPTESRE